MSENIIVFANPLELAEKLSIDFIEFVKHRKNVNIALSGGSTPKLFFETLVKYKEDINWSGVHFYWGDERCVAPNHADSNYRMTKESLLQNIDIPEQNVHRILGENDPTKETSRYAQEILDNLPITNQLPKFDWVVLGLGIDGHTASLFPNTPELKNRNDLCIIAKHPDTGQKRVSFTFPLLENATRLSFLVTGKSKMDIFDKILNKNIISEDFPASLLFSKRPDAEWWVDKDAINLYQNLL